jgi:hypothetical protein
MAALLVLGWFIASAVLALLMAAFIRAGRGE